MKVDKGEKFGKKRKLGCREFKEVKEERKRVLTLSLFSSRYGRQC